MQNAVTPAVSPLLVHSEQLLERSRQIGEKCDQASNCLRNILKQSATACLEAARLIDALFTRQQSLPKTLFEPKKTLAHILELVTTFCSRTLQVNRLRNSSRSEPSDRLELRMREPGILSSNDLS